MASDKPAQTGQRSVDFRICIRDAGHDFTFCIKYDPLVERPRKRVLECCVRYEIEACLSLCLTETVEGVCEHVSMCVCVSVCDKIVMCVFELISFIWTPVLQQ